MIVFKPPQTAPIFKQQPGFKRIFLAGSIEMGKAVNWQQEFVKFFGEEEDFIFFDPRRDDWDSSWVQEFENPQFRGQVEWELMALEAVDTIVMYFDPNTKSPITLLELGIHAKTTPNKLIVCCPKGFWRKGNVDVVCDFYNIKTVDTLEQLAKSARTHNNKEGA